MVAPAGCGKTHLIGTAVAEYGGGRELVLTHTHAGVDAIRRRMTEFGVPSRAYRVTTIAGWALQYSASFPKSSGITSHTPTKDQWTEVYEAAARVLRLSAIHEVLRASYSGVYVDEYQDCTVQQHVLVSALADVLPCRLLGDPLQGIFGFGKNKPIVWDEHVARSFDNIPGPEEPWRWKNHHPELGAWLREVRSDLIEERDINLEGDCPVRWIRLRAGDNTPVQVSACRGAAFGPEESVVAIRRWSRSCHKSARSLRGMYSCVEPIDCDDLFKWADRIENAYGYQRAVVVIDFVGTCVTRVKSELKGVHDAFMEGKRPGSKKYRHQVDSLLNVTATDSLLPVADALTVISRIPGVPPDRRELLTEMKRTIREYECGKFETLSEAAWKVRNRTRAVGRRLAHYCMGTTLLVKGLEFDHAVVLDADELDRKNLYVALTRGRKSLTVLSREPILRPNG